MSGPGTCRQCDGADVIHAQYVRNLADELEFLAADAGQYAASEAVSMNRDHARALRQAAVMLRRLLPEGAASEGRPEDAQQTTTFILQGREP